MITLREDLIWGRNGGLFAVGLISNQEKGCEGGRTGKAGRLSGEERDCVDRPVRVPQASELCRLGSVWGVKKPRR